MGEREGILVQCWVSVFSTFGNFMLIMQHLESTSIAG